MKNYNVALRIGGQVHVVKVPGFDKLTAEQLAVSTYGGVVVDYQFVTMVMTFAF